jgi:hypothetical protein
MTESAPETPATPRKKTTKKPEGKRPATLDHLKKKQRAQETFSIFITDEDGDSSELTLTFRAIGGVEYDKLVSKHPPTNEQRVEGGIFNVDTFGPALLSRVSIEPEMSEKDALEIWNSAEWSRGDLMVLFRKAVDVNNRGMDIPFNATV